MTRLWSRTRQCLRCTFDSATCSRGCRARPSFHSSLSWRPVHELPIPSRGQLLNSLLLLSGHHLFDNLACAFDQTHTTGQRIAHLTNRRVGRLPGSATHRAWQERRRAEETGDEGREQKAEGAEGATEVTAAEDDGLAEAVAAIFEPADVTAATAEPAVRPSIVSPWLPFDFLLRPACEEDSPCFVLSRLRCFRFSRSLLCHFCFCFADASSFPSAFVLLCSCCGFVAACQPIPCGGVIESGVASNVASGSESTMNLSRTMTRCCCGWMHHPRNQTRTTRRTVCAIVIACATCDSAAYLCFCFCFCCGGSWQTGAIGRESPRAENEISRECARIGIDPVTVTATGSANGAKVGQTKLQSAGMKRVVRQSSSRQCCGEIRVTAGRDLQ